MERAIAALNLAENVRLIGFHAHPEQLIALSDLTVLTSLREGLPRVTVQALAGGRPVVTTVLPGIEEVIKHGINGLITPVMTCESPPMRSPICSAALPDFSACKPLRQARTSRRGESTSMCAALADIYDRFIPKGAAMPAAQLR